MKELIFEGYSDDTFGEQTTGVDFDDCASGTIMQFVVTAGDERIIVSGQYYPEPTTGWQISVAPGAVGDDDGNAVFPDWPMTITRGDRPYTPRLTIQAPDNATVAFIDDAGDE